MKLDEKNAVKRNLFFVHDDVLAPGLINPKVDAKKIASAMEFLSGLEKKGVVSLRLFLGFEEKKAKEKLSKSPAAKHFKKENIHFVTKEYLNSLEEMDRERRLANLESDPDFVDEFFKQRAMDDLFAQGAATREDSALICHDIWFDAFYSTRFSGVDFFIVKESLSERNRPLPEKINGLNYISFAEEDLKKIILGKFPRQDVRFLETYVFNKLKLELFDGTKLDGLVKKSVLGPK
ncbi:MAG: hypothetical protein NUV67_01620 [archaeon]|nr:hypothetical protein [archaeon]